MTKYAISPVDCRGSRPQNAVYITAGKPYEIVMECNGVFYIINNVGHKNTCLFRGCGHIRAMGCDLDYQIVEGEINL